MFKGVSLQKILQVTILQKNNSNKEYQVQLLTRFTSKRMIDYNNNLTKYLFNMCRI
jgi:hypothetical protein